MGTANFSEKDKMKTLSVSHLIVHLLVAIGLTLSLLTTSIPIERAAALTPQYRFVGPNGNNNSNNDCTSNIIPCLTVGYAITKSNSDDTIEIFAGIYNENLVVDKNLNFSGAGIAGGAALTTTLDGGGVGPVINISGPFTVSFLNVIVQHGNVNTNGGGILNQGGTLKLERVKVINNTANNGAGIYSTGPLELIDVAISDNTANKTSASNGGAIFANQAGLASLSRVTISHNTATNLSGGIHQQGGGTLNLTNVTISGNTSNMDGALTNAAGSANLVNSTIADNHVIGTGASVGGIANQGTISFKNTIVANNDLANCSAISGTWTSLGHNLDSGNTCGFTQTGDLQNTDPMLGTLSGGPYDIQFQVHPLLPGSPAINAGTNVGCPDTDGWGGNRPVGAFCDIGAAEFGYTSPTTNLLNSVLPTSRTIPVGTTATIFNSVINTGGLAANNVVLYMAPPPAGTFSYQQTNCTTNAVMGSMNPVLDLPSHGQLCYVLYFSPSAPFAATDVHIRAVADNAPATGLYTGINTWLLRATSASEPDIIALTTTTDFHIPTYTGAGAFAVALTNVGAPASQITVVADDGGIGFFPLPVTITVNETDPATGAVIGDHILQNVGA
jgi:hypothetical protein